MTDGSQLQPVVSNQSMVLYSSAEGTESVTYSNTVNTLVVGPVLSLQKQADRLSASLGETLVYTVTARNSGNTGAVVTITDVLPPGVSFIANSVLRDGVPLPGVTPSSGIPLGLLAPIRESVSPSRSLSSRFRLHSRCITGRLARIPSVHLKEER